MGVRGDLVSNKHVQQSQHHLCHRFSRPKGNTSNLVIVHTEQASARL